MITFQTHAFHVFLHSFAMVLLLWSRSLSSSLSFIFVVFGKFSRTSDLAATKSGSSNNDNDDSRARLRERCIICALKSCVRCATAYMVMIWAVIAGTIVATNCIACTKFNGAQWVCCLFFVAALACSSFHFVCKCDERNDSIWSCVRIFLFIHEKKNDTTKIQCIPCRMSFSSSSAVVSIELNVCSFFSVVLREL